MVVVEQRINGALFGQDTLSDKCILSWKVPTEQFIFTLQNSKVANDIELPGRNKAIHYR
ncbi:MAG TPA: hypothetical protein VEG44_07505 [Candidatus Acidoferrales bacterium]|nr:hypothetical protein [Candidatus Acidoferrales bacterium]